MSRQQVYMAHPEHGLLPCTDRAHIKRNLADGWEIVDPEDWHRKHRAEMAKQHADTARRSAEAAEANAAALEAQAQGESVSAPPRAAASKKKAKRKANAPPPLRRAH